MRNIFSLSGLLRMALILSVWLTAFPEAHAQTPDWQSLIRPVGAGGYEVTATTTDAAGNLIIVGNFYQPIMLGTTTLTSYGMDDAFVAKWSPASRSFLWAHQIGGLYTDQAYEVVAAGGNVYVAGEFASGDAKAGSITLINRHCCNPTSGVFVAKLTDAGTSATFAWAESISGLGFRTVDLFKGLAVNGSSVYLAGSFSTEAMYKNTSIPGGHVLVKLLDNGTTTSFGWLERIGTNGASNNTINETSVDMVANGSSVYFTGWFQGTGQFGNTTLTSAGGADGYIAKLIDSGGAGGFVWAQSFGGASSEFPFAMALQGTDVYVTGTFINSARFGNTTLTSAGNKDLFVAKLNDAGTTASYQWAQRAGGSENDVSRAIAVRGIDVYVAGSFAGTAAFDTNTLTSVNSNEIFVAKLQDGSATGTFQWAQQAGGPSSDDVATNVSLSVDGTLYVGGIARAPAIFGALSLTQVGPAYMHGFLATLATGTTLSTPSAARLELGLYPNPAHTTVQLPAATAATKLTLLDNLGRTVRQGNGNTLSVLGVAPGLYILQAATPGQALRTARLVVE
ncbi:T9SS type A sorting domain-containing protein [Hymenobacter lucidus]|uniref:T9SS type A sorting domain-containing protein n=1 Tax=Hymenobacter lucidus TaxID=2880930 RepID=A0ABS8ANW3_9BACT|nr:T9SS type A sorting domain-containing protein [Hymenobacter lucidus]MCB2407124.1 T9SS type A sorting domain-containing protein [Hymenobacter lucidus]